MEEKMNAMTLVQLRTMAKEQGITGASGKNKQELIELLAELEKKNRPQKSEEKAAEGNADTNEEKKAEKKTAEGVRAAQAGPEIKRTREKRDRATELRTERGTESRMEERTEPRTERGTESRMEGRTEPRMERRTESRMERRTEPRTEGGTEPRTEGGAEERRENRQETRGEYRTDTRRDFRTENRNDGRGDSRGNAMNSLSSVNPQPSEVSHLDSGETKEGILEIMPEGFGFIRCDNFLPGENDVYVSPLQIRRMNLKTGDFIIGNTKIRTQTEKFSALLYVKSINGFPVEAAIRRPRFEDLTPIFPNERIHLETPGCGPAMRMVDLVSPIGKGQRGMIVAQPKAGKTTLLKQIAKAVNRNHPDMHMIILLIDERPEEVTDMKESISGDNVEVIYSTFDELPDKHKRVSEMVIERAKRLVEHGQDVIILLDSITRLARAYNLTIQSSGRTLSGGLDPAALYMPKKFFGAARNMRGGGSLTILATALVETGSRMDDVVFEEFKGTGNMELVLDRNLSERRVFPAIDLPKSSTRREDLLLSKEEAEANILMRRAFNGMKSEDAVEKIIQMFAHTRNNVEFIETIKKTKIEY